MLKPLVLKAWNNKLVGLGAESHKPLALRAQSLH